MSKIAKPIAGHITASPEWNRLANEAAYTLHAALKSGGDVRVRYEAKARYGRLVRRRRALRDEVNAQMAQFDAKANDIAQMRRHAFATVPTGGSLKALMN